MGRMVVLLAVCSGSGQVAHVPHINVAIPFVLGKETSQLVDAPGGGRVMVRSIIDFVMPADPRPALAAPILNEVCA